MILEGSEIITKRKSDVITVRYIKTRFSKVVLENVTKQNIQLKDSDFLIRYSIKGKNVLYLADEQLVVWI